MNLNHPDIQTYLQKLPPVVQKCITSTEWETKISDIGKKYSLTTTQTTDLEMEILLVALGIESDEDMVENIKNQLSISETLAEQLTEDANERIYQWIYKKLNNEKEVSETLDKKSLDIPPPNLPGEMIGEESVIPAPTLEQTLVPEIHVIPPQPLKDTHILTSQAGPTPQTTPTEAPKPSFIASKLTQTTKPIQPLPEIPKTYTIDPYREPIE